MMAPIGFSLSNIDLDGCRAKKGRLPEKPPSSHCSLVTFLKRSAARLERPKARVNPYDAAGYALADRGVDTRTLQAFIGHRSIANTVIYTAVADTVLPLRAQPVDATLHPRGKR